MNREQYAEALAIVERLVELGVLQEHPGHADQRVHAGNRPKMGGLPHSVNAARKLRSITHRERIDATGPDFDKVMASSDRAAAARDKIVKRVGLASFHNPDHNTGEVRVPVRKDARAEVDRAARSGLVTVRQTTPADTNYSHAMAGKAQPAFMKLTPAGRRLLRSR